MFNSTHTFVGLLIAKMGVGKWARYGTATAVIASNLPDIDSIAGFWGTATYLEHHRGITHSLIGIPALALLLSVVMYFFSGNFGKTYAIALIAMTTHPVLDLLNPYGLRPFLPWSDKWYYGDLVFIFDPYLDAVLVLGLVSASLWTDRRRLALSASVLAAACYIGLRIELHAMAASRIEPYLQQGSETRKWALIPNMLDPRRWDAVLQTNSEILRFDVDATASSAVEPRVTHIDTGPRSEIVDRAAMAHNAKAILRFARFPVTRVEQLPQGYRVVFYDFRFHRGDGATALAAEVLLDNSLNVTKDNLSFVQPLNSK